MPYSATAGRLTARFMKHHLAVTLLPLAVAELRLVRQPG